MFLLKIWGENLAADDRKGTKFWFSSRWITIFFNLFIKLLITFFHKNLNPKFHWFLLVNSATMSFTFYQSNGENSEFAMVFLVKICDETYMHLHMKWWFLIFSFHSLTTLCGSATTIAKPQRAINVKIVNFIIFLRNKINYSAKFDFWLNCRRNLYCLFKAFLRASADRETVQLDLWEFQNHPPYRPNRVGVSCLAFKSIWAIISGLGLNWLCWNPSIYNIIFWFAGPMGQTTRQPSVWCSK